MRAMVLAAGRGARMRHLTRTRPKPLVEVAGRGLIAHQLGRLAAAGYREVVVNLAYRGAQIRAALGDGRAFGLRLAYSEEGEAPLGTGGGIRHALDLLGDAPFLVINADVWSTYPFERLARFRPRVAHLVLVDNPAHRAGGDYALAEGRVSRDGSPRLTYSGIGVFQPSLFRGWPARRFPLTHPLDEAAADGTVSGEHYRGCWLDVGTPERLRDLERRLERQARPREL